MATLDPSPETVHDNAERKLESVWPWPPQSRARKNHPSVFRLTVQARRIKYQNQDFMWQTIVEAVVEFLAEWLIALFWWIILFPIVWLVSLPFILVIAAFPS